MSWKPLHLPYKEDPETKKVLKNLSTAHRALAELKGVAQSIPRQEILINTLTFQEAKDSSEVENIITTHDELYKSSLGFEEFISPAAKEVESYSLALKHGFTIVSQRKILSGNNIIEIQRILEKNNSGFRKLPGTNLKNQQTGEVVYEPPQSADEIQRLMQNLVEFMNNDELIDYDPIVKMAIIHFQFESIHPFYDGNGRTGRIINILYLVLQNLLDIPILYLSRYIIKHKGDYYRFLQDVRDNNNWESWILFMIKAVEETAIHTIDLIKDIKQDMMYMKNILRDNYKFYSQELLNHLFKMPYTKIEFLKNDLKISRVTASNYLNKLSDDNIIHKHKLGKSNYYINPLLMNTLIKKQ
ncbi:Fic family protein [uncultured Aquimarina sp.]|uniref:Fic family protein n=1 Tax=uncultured Aquimarina sp. TaxID=575652 RepID=UPI002628C598|nr:Fic family protein [uncultured Aquimarina sp.]